MPPLSLLIKPASGACNLRCGYCFYADEAMKRSVPSYGMMSSETLENVLRRAIAYADGSLSLGFQGGEPTLRGAEFFEECMRIVERENTKGLRVSYALQTNGTMLDERWMELLRRGKWLVGLSLDGTQTLHDRLRRDAAGQGTFERVLAAAELLRENKVDFNVLTVVTGYTARNIDRVYAFFRKNGLLYQQYIPCLDPLGEPRGREGYSLTPALYGRFMKDLFDLWYADVTAGRFIYIRHLENLLGLILGHPAEHCGLMGHCSMQSVVEADGSVYPCDFYVLDRYRLGNLNDVGFPELFEAEKKLGFIAASVPLPEDCRRCEWVQICRGGCRRDRDTGTELAKNYFCDAYKQFYAYAMPRFLELARRCR